ncbi:MAG: deoxyribodipyrimidine photo-lyase [Hyphomonadaceae bacterium]|nr:deoxyribodipyrimidine photo-lyase [Hyphomonadaceae bacterium]
MSDAPVIVWLRQDLRLADNPALHAAAQTGRPLVLAYILDDVTPGRWRLGGASRWWLHRSLEALASAIAKRGGVLVLRRGDAHSELRTLIGECGASAVFWNRCYEPYIIERDKRLVEDLERSGVETRRFNGALLNEPWEAKTKLGEPFKVFTPYWRAAQQRPARTPLPAPKRLKGCDTPLRSDPLGEWNLLPRRPNWAAPFETEWKPGEAGALEALQRFVSERLQGYAEGRDRMGLAATSRLSPHLHWGEISPVQVRAAIESAAHAKPALQRCADKFLSEIGWREFSYNLLYHCPTLPERNWRSQFDAMPWADDEPALEAWQRGRTGYPLVDAAMRELWNTGTMHNRARMVVASFLVKHLMIDWRRGEDWFWDTLVDADLANNAASWQWVAGSGADASPYFRIFNPVAQGERYDPDGVYVRRWVPELARLPNSVIHQPWQAERQILTAAGVELGRTYPLPIVEHAAARARALAAYARISSAA